MSSCCASWSLPAARLPMAWRSVHFCVFSLISLKVVNLIINHSKKMWRAFRIFRIFVWKRTWSMIEGGDFMFANYPHDIFQKLAGHYNILYHSGLEIYAMWLTILASGGWGSWWWWWCCCWWWWSLMIPDFNLFGWRWSHQHPASRYIIPELVWRNTYSNPVY